MEETQNTKSRMKREAKRKLMRRGEDKIEMREATLRGIQESKDNQGWDGRKGRGGEKTLGRGRKERTWKSRRRGEGGRERKLLDEREKREELEKEEEGSSTRERCASLVGR